MVAFPRGNQLSQDRFLRDIAPGWTLYQGGLGSGKSWAAARKLLYLHGLNRCQSLAVAPTYGDIWRFVVPAMVQTLEEWQWPYRIVRNVVPMIEVGGVPILLISGEHPERFAGFEVGAIWIDEGARIQASAEDPLRDAPTQIRTRLRDHKAKILHGMVSTTPEGRDTWVQRDWYDKPVPEHRAYQGKTRDNPALPASYAGNLAASLAPELLDQYLDGTAVNYVAGKAHKSFSRALHVRSIEYQSHLPVHLGADFNTSPLCWHLGQQVGEAYHVLDELVIPDYALVDAAVHEADLKGWGRHGLVTMHPDKSSKNRSTTGDPEWTVMERTARNLGWNVAGNAYGANPPVNGRINNLSRMLLDGAGKSRLVIHPRCSWVIDDLEFTARGSNGYDPGRDGRRGHMLDGLGYVLWDLFQPAMRASVSNVL